MKVTYGKGFEVAKPVDMRTRVDKLEQSMLELPQVDCPVRHYFAPGLYAREMSIPAGTVVTGAVHKTENLIVISMGRVHMVTPDGTRELVAGDTITCKAGMKNAFMALEDSRWTNFMHNPENITDVERLAEFYTESKASELLGGADNLQMAANKAAERIEA